MPKITTLLFDCDNTLVLSESLAFEACADLANEILEKHGKPDRYTGPQLLSEFVGQNFRGMMVSLQKKYDIALSQDDLEAYVSREEDEVIKKLKAKLVPCEGVDTVLENLKGKYTLAVVSSSALRRVKVSVEVVKQDKFFDQRIYSAASSLPKPTSKPDPAIYLHAMKDLGVTAAECIAIEDSKSGATSAKNAKIRTVGYVGSYEPEEREKMEKVLLECNAKPIMKNWKEFPQILAAIEKE